MEKSIKILISGPIRPSEDAVISIIKAVRDQIPNSCIFLSTWGGQLTDKIRNAVDFAGETPEPTEQFIQKMVSARTRQQRALGTQLEGWTYTIFKMIYGVQCVCDLARPHVNDTDIAIRIRTDSMFQFHPDYLQSLLANSSKAYIAKKGDGFDWFAITPYSVLRSVWYFSNIQEYNTTVERSWNAESIIQSRVPVPIEYLDPLKVDAYIIRENGRKHYFP